MRKLLLALSFGLVSYISHAQTFYIQPTEKGYEDNVRQKMDYEGYKLVSAEGSADYRVDCLLKPYKGNKYKFIGYVRITNLKTGQEVGRTEEVKKRVTAFIGYNAGNAIFKEIAAEYLDDLLKECKAL